MAQAANNHLSITIDPKKVNAFNERYEKLVKLIGLKKSKDSYGIEPSKLNLLRSDRKKTKGVVLKKTKEIAVQGSIVSYTQHMVEYANDADWTGAELLEGVPGYLGPALTAGTCMYNSYNIIKQWRAGEITTADMKRSMARLISKSILSVGGTIAAGAFIGGPIGFIVGASFVVGITVADKCFGEKVLGRFIKDDPEEAKKVLIKKFEKLQEDVLLAAYELLGLRPQASDDDLKAVYRAALRKYHPDKGGDAVTFIAVYKAYTVITDMRRMKKV